MQPGEVASGSFSEHTHTCRTVQISGSH